MYMYIHPHLKEMIKDKNSVKSGNFFGRGVNSGIDLQTVEIQMSRLIRIFTVCLVNLFFMAILEL